MEERHSTTMVMRDTSRSPATVWRLLAVALVAWSGCSNGDRPALGRVAGVVTLDGQPLADAEVSFAPEKGRPSVGRTDASGRYDLLYVGTTKGAKVGKHRVFISRSADDSDGGEESAAKAGTAPIPAQYNLRSTLTADVRRGSNTFDFALESK